MEGRLGYKLILQDPDDIISKAQKVLDAHDALKPPTEQLRDILAKEGNPLEQQAQALFEESLRLSASAPQVEALRAHTEDLRQKAADLARIKEAKKRPGEKDPTYLERLKGMFVLANQVADGREALRLESNIIKNYVDELWNCKIKALDLVSRYEANICA